MGREARRNRDKWKERPSPLRQFADPEPEPDDDQPVRRMTLGGRGSKSAAMLAATAAMMAMAPSLPVDAPIISRKRR